MSRILQDDIARHNGGVTDTVFFHHLKALTDLEKQEMTIKAKKSAAKKAAEDDGVNWADMKYAAKQNHRPLAEQLEEYNRRLTYLKFFKLPMAAQMDFIDPNLSDTTGLTDEQREENWKSQGFQAGVLAVNRDTCPHDPNSVAGRFWLQGYEEGQAKNAAGIKAPADEAPAAKKKAGGRKAKEQDPPAPTEETKASDDKPLDPPVSDDEWDAAAPKDGDGFDDGPATLDDAPPPPPED